jgi:hypothetical protein
LTKPDVGSLVLVLGAASLGVIASRLHHRVVFPTVVKVIEKRVPSRSLVRGTIGWAISLAIGMAVGFALHAGIDAEGWLLAIALSTTSLGTLVPILGDGGLLATPLGSATLGTGVAGEFWPIVVISVFLTGVYGAAAEVLLLLAFGALVALAAAAALRARPPRVVRVLRETVHTTGRRRCACPFSSSRRSCCSRTTSLEGAGRSHSASSARPVCR